MLSIDNLLKKVAKEKEISIKKSSSSMPNFFTKLYVFLETVDICNTFIILLQMFFSRLLI